MRSCRLFLVQLFFCATCWSSSEHVVNRQFFHDFTLVEEALGQLDLLVRNEEDDRLSDSELQNNLKDITCELACRYMRFIGYDEETVPLKMMKTKVGGHPSTHIDSVPGMVLGVNVHKGSDSGEYLVKAFVRGIGQTEGSPAAYWGMLNLHKFDTDFKRKPFCVDDLLEDTSVLKLSGPGGRLLTVKLPYNLQKGSLDETRLQQIIAEQFHCQNLSHRIFSLEPYKEVSREHFYLQARPTVPAGVYSLAYEGPASGNGRIGKDDFHIDGGILSLRSANNLWRVPINSASHAKEPIPIGPGLVVYFGKRFKFFSRIQETFVRVENPFSNSSFDLIKQLDWSKLEDDSFWQFASPHIRALITALDNKDPKRSLDLVKTVLPPMLERADLIKNNLAEAEIEILQYATWIGTPEGSPRDDTAQFQISPRDNPLNKTQDLPMAAIKKK